MGYSWLRASAAPTLAGLALAVLALTACNPSQNAAEPKTNTAPPAPALSQDGPTKAQPRLQTIKLWLGKEELIAEIARTPIQIQTGMMFRTNMPANEGMLFVMPRPHQAAFWMRNTLLPLSCAYIDSEGTILELHDMKPKDETSIVAKSTMVQYVLEVNQGYFQRHNIEPGMKVVTETGTLRQTFFGR